MVHRTQINNVIGTHELVYSNSPLGNLDRNIWFRNMTIPLQEGFDSDINTALPIGIYNLTTLAFEQGIVGAVSISQGTAMATPFACMPAIHNIQMNIIIKAPLLKNLLELIKRNSHNNFIEPFSFWFESFKLFNRNIGIISDSKINDFFNNLSEIGIDEITFIESNPFKLLFGIKGLEQGSSFHYLFSFDPDMLPKIGLIEDFSFWRDDADSKMFGIDINSENILSLLDFLFLREISGNLQIFSQAECLANPIIVNQALKSLIIPVLLDWNSNPNFWIQTKPDKEIGFGIESLAVSRNIKLDSQPIDFVGFLLPSVSYETASDLNIKRGVFLAN